MTAMALVRLLTPVLPGAALQRHLTECAVYELIDRSSAPWLPRLTKRHVLGIRRLPAPERRHSVFPNSAS